MIRKIEAQIPISLSQLFYMNERQFLEDYIQDAKQNVRDIILKELEKSIKIKIIDRMVKSEDKMTGGITLGGKIVVGEIFIDEEEK